MAVFLSFASKTFESASIASEAEITSADAKALLASSGRAANAALILGIVACAMLISFRIAFGDDIGHVHSIGTPSHLARYAAFRERQRSKNKARASSR